MSERESLKSCPFCGGEARCDTGKSAFVDAEITCLACGTTGPNFDDGDRVFNREAAITAWNTRARPEPSEAVVEAVAQSLGDVLSSRERYYFTDPTRNHDGSLSMAFDGEVDLTELARAAIAAYEAERSTP